MPRKELTRAEYMASLGASGPWVEAQRGETWTDDAGNDHVVVGVVQEGFDSTFDGRPENHRIFWHEDVLNEEKSKKADEDVFDRTQMILHEDDIAAVSAWKRKV